MTTITKLAKQTAEAEIQDFMSESFRPQGVHVQSALDQQAKAYVEALKVARDALEEVKKTQTQFHSFCLADKALRHITELLPK